jgi:group I intron endonuclease
MEILRSQKIYTLSSSDNPNNIRYVGYTTQRLKKRLQDHIDESKLASTHKQRWINSVIKKGNKIIITEIISVFTSIEDLKFIEIQTIKKYREIGFDLTNATDGGDGTHGYACTPERKKKISEATKKAMTPEVRKKLSDAAKRRRWSDEHKKKIGDFFRGERNPNYKKVYTTEMRAKLREIQKPRRKSVIQKTIDGEIITVFESMHEAERTTGIRQGSISNSCSGRTTSAGGYRWEFNN